MLTRRRLAAVAAGAGLAVMAIGGAAGGSPATSAAQTAVYHRLVSVAAGKTSLHPNQSNNWSGYNQGLLEKGGGPYTSISGQWVVPTATQHTAGQAESSATWVGIGGGCVDANCLVTDPTLVQAGTEQDVAANGKASYSAWWEIVPVPSISISMAVHPGDHMKVSLNEGLPGLWTISIDNLTSGATFQTTVPYASTGDTAEWIEETPVVISTSGAGIAAMPNLGSVNFSNATVNGANAGLKPSEEMQLVDNGTVLATPSAPNSTGNGFNDCTYATSCPAP